MSDVTRRISRWKAKYSPDIAAQTTARIFADMNARQPQSTQRTGGYGAESRPSPDSVLQTCRMVVFATLFLSAASVLRSSGS
jgi:hypothetical protein